MNSAAPVDAQKTLDENERIIADNQRMIAVLQSYSRADSKKLDRLTAQCQDKLGDTVSSEGARSRVECIHSAG